MAAYKEEEFVLNKFIQNFSQYKNKKMVLYGTGKNTKTILQKCEQDFCVVGIMDVGKESTIYYGKEVLSKEQISNLHVDLIVLICLPVSEDIVYERIREFAEQSQIKVYNLDGVKLQAHVDKCLLMSMSDLEKEKIVKKEGSSALLKYTVYRDFERKADTWTKSRMLDFFTKELLEHPSDVKEDGRILIADFEKLGYLYWGPVLAGFLLWMVKEVINDNCDIILFQSRDGYLLQKMYRILKREYKEVQFPTDVYFLTSRRASMVPGIRTEEDIRIAARYPWYGSNVDFLKNRFGVQAEGKEFPEIEPEHYALLFKEEIFERAEKERSNYKKYINNLCLHKYRKAALIDTTAAGTVQTNLQHFMELPIKGYYFLKRVSEIEENNRIDYRSYYPIGTSYEIRKNIFAYFRFMEMVLSSTDGSLICFDKNGEPEYAKEKRGKVEKNVLQDLQEGVLKYFEDICNMNLKWHIMRLDRDFGDEILGTMNRKYIIVNDDIIKNLTMVDYFMNIEKRVCERF